MAVRPGLPDTDFNPIGIGRARSRSQLLDRPKVADGFALSEVRGDLLHRAHVAVPVGSSISITVLTFQPASAASARGDIPRSALPWKANFVL